MPAARGFIGLDRVGQFLIKISRYLEVNKNAFLDGAYVVHERKVDNAVISSVARNLILLKRLSLQISPFGRNDKKRGFRSDTI